jgi:hypothetical protein
MFKNIQLKLHSKILEKKIFCFVFKQPSVFLQNQKFQLICINIGGVTANSYRTFLRRIILALEEKHVISPSMTPIVSEWLDFFSG